MHLILIQLSKYLFIYSLTQLIFIMNKKIYYEQGIVPRTVGYAKKCNNGYFGTVTDKEKNQYFSELNCL